MEQIMELTYLENEMHWYQVAAQNGGLEICSDFNGEPMYTIGKNPDGCY